MLLRCWNVEGQGGLDPQITQAMRGAAVDAESLLNSIDLPRRETNAQPEKARESDRPGK